MAFHYHNAQQKILIYTNVTGYKHSAIPSGIRAVYEIAEQHAIQVDTTTNNLDFNSENLEQYKAVIFISTNPGTFKEEQKKSFKHYIRNGGGFIGIHSASAGIRDWPWYTKMVGALFKNHPPPTTARLNKTHLASENELFDEFPNAMDWQDEWYNFENIQKDIQVILTVDSSSYPSGKGNTQNPVAWYHNYDGGKAFYIALGHFSYHYTDFFYRNLIASALIYVTRSD
ncbi:ThuA domain-containing protein [Galbibacter orientalis]|uniref:ThuA domain-containing protein n=1 Tax=Galbibacter orientalis TaxID=453852 RepID=UPI0030802466